MKTESSTTSRRRATIAWAAATLSVVLAGYAIPGAMNLSAQQTSQQGQNGGRRRAAGTTPDVNGGAAAGPQEGAQAVSADPQHGQTPAPPPAQRGGLVAYPERPQAPAAQIAAGKATFSVNCAFCHGSDAGGGSVGPNLLRSDVVLQDQDGELIAPIVHGARVDRGMPKIDISDAQIKDVAAWLHSLRVASRSNTPVEKINIVVGNATAGKPTFDRMCGSCHSVSGDLKGFADKYTDPRAMQQAWIMPVVAGGRGPGGGANAPKLDVPPATVTVTQANGTKVTGNLDTIDDFYVSLTTPDGEVHRFTRNGDLPKVELHDPLAAHRELLRKYTDKDIHDITAYLETLK